MQYRQSMVMLDTEMIYDMLWHQVLIRESQKVFLTP